MVSLFIIIEILQSSSLAGLRLQLTVRTARLYMSVLESSSRFLLFHICDDIKRREEVVTFLFYYFNPSATSPLRFILSLFSIFITCLLIILLLR